MSDLCYKVEIELDKQKIEAERKYSLNAILKAFNGEFGAYPEITKLETKYDYQLAFAVKKNDDFGTLRACIINVYCSCVKPYFTKIKFKHLKTGMYEDLLEGYKKSGME